MTPATAEELSSEKLEKLISDTVEWIAAPTRNRYVFQQRLLTNITLHGVKALCMAREVLDLRARLAAEVERRTAAEELLFDRDTNAMDYVAALDEYRARYGGGT